MKKALIVDWLDQYGGAERVISSMTKIFDFDICYALINIMSIKNQKKVFSNKRINIVESKLKYSSKFFRYFFYLFPYFISKTKVDKSVSLIISSSFAVAKGVKKSRPSQIHFCYIQARNQRYIWDNEGIYFNRIFKFVLYPLIKYLQRRDIEQAKRPDHIISNSKFVQEWVSNKYKLKSHIIYPPVDLDKFKLVEKKENYYVTASRLEPYKRVDLIIKAFNSINDKLVVLGDGSQLEYLKSIANNNISFLNFCDSDVVFKYVSKARGFLHAGIEDFGIAPVEAQACGTPIIAFAKGGVLESVVENKTGVFFYEQNYEAILEALVRFNKTRFNYKEVRKNALKFSVKNFESNFEKYIKENYCNTQ